MEWLQYIWENEILKVILLVLLGLILLIFLILFIIHLIKVKNGEYSRFFWVESSSREGLSKDTVHSKIKGKNINTGTNFGKVGDN